MRGSLGYGIDILLTRVIEGAASLPAFIINLLNATSTRVTTRTVLAYASDALYTDGPVLTTLNVGEVAITGGRRATTVADGAVLGSDLISVAADREFSSDTGYWTKATGVTIGGGVASFNAVAKFQGLTKPSIGLTDGRVYRYSFEIKNHVFGSIMPQVGTSTFGSIASGNGVYTGELTAAGVLTFILRSQVAGTTLDIDNVSVKEVIPTWYSTDINGVPFSPAPTMSNEDSATQKLLNADAPATQTTASLGIGTWTLNVIGAGSALASGNTATITGAAAATEGSPNTFTVTVAGTVNVTVTGLLDYFQLEAGDVATSIIISAGTEVTRGPDINTVPVSNVHTKDLGFERLEFTPYVGGQVNKYLRSFYIDATHTLDLYINATQVIVSYVDGASTDSAAFTYSHLQAVPITAEWGWDSVANKLRVRAAASSGDISGETFVEATFAGMTALPATSYIGCKNDSSQAAGEFGNPIDYISAEVAGVL